MTQQLFLSLTTLLAIIALWNLTERVFEKYGVLSDHPAYKFLATGFVACMLGAGVGDAVTLLFYGVN